MPEPNKPSLEEVLPVLRNLIRHIVDAELEKYLTDIGYHQSLDIKAEDVPEARRRA